MALITWYKNYTETLDQTLKRFFAENPKHIDAKVTYAGRLDPMAEGLLIFLTDSDVHRKEEFLSLDKVYEVEFLLGVTTDTYDILGIITETQPSSVSDKALQNELTRLAGRYRQAYPPYSSKTVEGKPLWRWAREGRLDEIDIPERDVTISNVHHLEKKVVTAHELQELIDSSVNLVTGDFRQDEICVGWKEFFSQNSKEVFDLHKISLEVSSGTYVRSIIHTLGQRLRVGAVCLKITRTSIGPYRIDN